MYKGLSEIGFWKANIAILVWIQTAPGASP